MSFLGNLAKGFVRSAVNQVGRDGGKVISNRIYKNSHANKVELTNNQEPVQEVENSLIESQEAKEYVWVKFMWAFFIAICLPFIGPAIIYQRSYKNYNNKKSKAIGYIIIASIGLLFSLFLL